MTGSEAGMVTRSTLFVTLMETLEHNDAPTDPGAAAPEEVWTALEAASVSSWFSPDELRSRGISQASLEALMADCERNWPDGPNERWSVREDRRRLVFSQRLRAPGRLGAAINGMVGGKDALTDALASYAAGVAKPLNEQDAVQLEATERVAGWLDGMVEGVPDMDAISLARGRRALFQPLERALGPNFVGRAKELARLQRFAAEGPAKGLRKLLGFAKARILPVAGIGGAGKSSLLAKFLLDATMLAPENGIAFAYLDFDRASISAADPAGLLVEIAGQLAFQFPEARTELRMLVTKLSQLYRAGEADAAEELAPIHGPASMGIDVAHPDPRLASMLEAFASAFGKERICDRPLLLVMDTFEEAIYETGPALSALWHFARRLSAAAPELGIIVCGRAVPPDGMLPNGVTFRSQIRIDRLEEAVAMKYLSSRGLKADAAARIVRQVGTLPLSLRLSADLLEKNPDEDVLRGITGVFPSWLRPEGWLMARLYARVLDHIHDDEVRALAHPGLVLRTITPEVIEHVIAPTANVVVRGEEHALELFKKFGREAGLMVSDGKRLRHPSDLRAHMLPLLTRNDPEMVKTMHRRAVAYWSGGGGAEDELPDLAARAEELYHRLCLGDDEATVETRWLAGVEILLMPSVHELPEEAAAFLSRRRVAAQVEHEPVWVGRSGGQQVTPAEVLEQEASNISRRTLGTRTRDLITEVRALDAKLRWPEALEKLDRASAAPGGDIGLSAYRADLMLRLGHAEAALALSEQEQSQLSGNTEAGLDLQLWGLAAARVLGSQSAAVEVLGRVRELAGILGIWRLSRAPNLFRRYVLLAGHSDPAAVTAFIVGAAPPDYSRPEREALGLALSAADVRRSARAGQAAGSAARRIGISATYAGKPDNFWARFAAEATPAALLGAISSLFETKVMDRGETAGFVKLARLRQPEWRQYAGAALSAAFPQPSQFAAFVRANGGVQLSDVGSLPDAVAAFVQVADRNGALAEVIDAAFLTSETAELAMVAKGLRTWLSACARESSDMEIAKAALEAVRPAQSATRFMPLVTKFHELPFVLRAKFAARLGLTCPDDSKLPTQALTYFYLERARVSGKLLPLAEILDQVEASVEGDRVAQ